MLCVVQTEEPWPESGWVAGKFLHKAHGTSRMGAGKSQRSLAVITGQTFSLR